MGYYETDATYPEIYDCADALIWGLDYEGNEITTSTKIRHHRFPDRKLLPHYTGSHIVPYGVMFDNITYPSPDIVAHRFCQATRTEFDKTVVDSGWAVNAPAFTSGPYSGDITLTGTFFNFTVPTNYVRYNSAEIFFNKKLFNTDYLKTNRGYRVDSQPLLYPADYAIYPVVNDGVNEDLRMNIYHLVYNADIVPERTNYKVGKQVYLPTASYTGTTNFPVNITNNNLLTADSVLELTYQLEDLDTSLGTQEFGAIENDPGKYALNNFYVSDGRFSFNHWVNPLVITCNLLSNRSISPLF